MSRTTHPTINRTTYTSWGTTPNSGMGRPTHSFHKVSQIIVNY